MEYPVKKLSIEEIAKEQFCPASPTIYEIMWDETKYEFLINHVPGAGKMAAFGTGTVNRARGLPDFKRNSWHPDIKVTSIWYADPTLYEGNLALYWYYGTNKRWHLKNIAFILAVICQKNGYSLEDSLLFGSSGGGYSSLVLATLLHGKAYVINPQIFLFNYFPDHYEKFLKDVLDAKEKPVEERVNIISLFKKERYLPRIHYVQNMQSIRDVRMQVIPFLKDISEKQMNCQDVLSMEYFYLPGGHNSMPDKDTSLELINRGLDDKKRGVAIAGKKNDKHCTFFERISRADLKNPTAYLFFDELEGFDEALVNTSLKFADNKLSYALELAGKAPAGYTFSFYLQSGQSVVDRIPYSTKTEAEFALPAPGTYRVKCFVLRGKTKTTFMSEEIAVKADDFK
ncbi:MAG: hypothetical protein IKD89_08005 [Clostridia bacterium]|nr:hypothetical protein [Clostridia bacterium]